jgi:uncharacterized DUF497 family protein
MPPRRKLAVFRGPRVETFAGITWDEANRAAHEIKRPTPRFEAARHADWSRVFKRKDAEHPGPPDRFQALVGRDLGVAYAVYFVVYAKVSGHLHIITIRFANDAERQVFFR